MAKSKDDITYRTAQARLSEDDALRIRYKAGTPLEGGKIADSQIAELSSSAQKIAAAKQKQPQQEEKHQDSSRQGKSTYVYEDDYMDKNLPPEAATVMFDSNNADNWTTNPP
ncbi:unnamed protein product [Withania somnifera]